MMPTIGIGRELLVDRATVKQLLIARLERLLGVEQEKFDNTREERKNEYAQARQPDVLDALSESSGFTRSLDEIDDGIARLTAAKADALELTLLPSQIVQHGSVVELKFDDQDQSELFLIFGGEGVHVPEIPLGERTIQQITKSCDLAIALFNLEAGERFGFNSFGGFQKGEITQVH